MSQQGTLLLCSVLFSFFKKSSSRLIYQSALLKWLMGCMWEWHVDSCSGRGGPMLEGSIRTLLHLRVVSRAVCSLEIGARVVVPRDGFSKLKPKQTKTL